MPSFTTSQKVAIALSIPVAGVLFYFLLKWARDDHEHEDDTIYGGVEFVSSSDLMSQMQIQQSHVGAVIGRGGSVIKQIQKESETRINFKDDEEESEDELTEEAKPKIRTMVIRGSRERIKHAEVLIKKVIDEQPVLEKITVEIPQQVVGRIIGKGGKTIRQLCKISGAKIKIDGNSETGDVQTCDITGTKTQIECAKQLIDEKISEDQEFRAKQKCTQQAKDKLTFAHLPVHGDYFGVYVSAMDTPGHFWIQIITKDAKQLDKLVEDMTQFYGDRDQGCSLIPAKVGDLCCGTFKHDESWYRGEIVELLEDRNEVRMHYLDFGDTGVVSMSNLKEIRKEFCDLPFQAIEVYFANIKPKGEKWSQDACDAFEKLSYCAQWKVLMARVVYYDDNGVPCIELIDTNTEKDLNIEKRLVEQDFAVYKEEILNPETQDNSETSYSSFQVSDPPVEQIVAEQKEQTLEQMNEQFRNAAFENDSSDMDESESFEFSSPITLSDQECMKDKAVVSEPSISTAEHKVVSCANISELENLFGCLNMDTSDGAGDHGVFENLIEEEDLDENYSENTHVMTQEGGELCEVDGDISEKLVKKHDFENPVPEHELETPESLLRFSEKFQEKQETFPEDDPTVNNVLSDLDAAEAVLEIPVTSFVNIRENFMEPITISSVEFPEHAVPRNTPEDDLLPDSKKELSNESSENILLVDNDQGNKDLSFINDLPVTSTPEYHLQTALSDYHSEDHDPNYGLRRSYSEDLRTDDTLTDGSLVKSSSEHSVSPNKDEEFTKVDNKTQLSSRSLGSLPFTPPKVGKRGLAANFGQIPSPHKHESEDDDDVDVDDDDGDDVSDDGSSLYLSAKEDSDSTGFLSAVGSRSNLRLTDTDSDATPSGYLSEPEGNSIEIGETANMNDATRLDTTLLVEKLEQHADK